MIGVLARKTKVGAVLRCALFGAVARSASGTGGALDVTKYELEVTLRGEALSVATTLHAEGELPRHWVLDLVPEMRVVSAESGGRSLTASTSGRTLSLDLNGLSLDADASFAVTIHCEGAPSERFSKERGGFVRSAVGSDRVYIRSQVPWYPRAPDDPAIHHIVVDAPVGWQVRSAGNFEAPIAQEGRSRWTFEAKRPLDRAGLAAGPWEVLSNDRFDALVTPGHEEQSKGLLSLTRDALEFYARDLGPLPNSRFALVEMPAEFGSGSGYSECGYFLLGPGAFEAGAEASWVRGFLAHEAAHQWWGQDGRFSDFANEALAEYTMLGFLESGAKDSAVQARRSAVEKVGAAAAAGKSVALGEIRGWGESLDPETYSVHAYQKAMMLLAMVERAVGRPAMSKLLIRFLGEARTRRVGWIDLRSVLVASGKDARAVVEQWEQAGLPTLRVESESKKTGNVWTTKGKLTQEGTTRPYSMSLVVGALCGEKRIDTDVKLSGPNASFMLRTASEPSAIVIDPDWVLLAAREQVGAADAKRTFEDAMKVANDLHASDATVLQRAIDELRAATKAEALSEGEQAAAHTGLGRCLFRLGKFDEAEKELQEALRLGAGGPFHRGWVHLRLGCIADLGNRRKEALEHYAAVISSEGSSETAVEKAKAFQAKPYRGYKTDG